MTVYVMTLYINVLESRLYESCIAIIILYMYIIIYIHYVI